MNSPERRRRVGLPVHLVYQNYQVFAQQNSILLRPVKIALVIFYPLPYFMD
jgi:hypothetical protein